MAKHFIIYETKNLKNGKIYIGMHETENLEDSYLGSGYHLKRAVRYYGREFFERKILFDFDNREDMINKEIELVNEEFIARQDTYNIKIGGRGGFSSDEHRKKNLKAFQQAGVVKLKELSLNAEWVEKISKKSKEFWKNSSELYKEIVLKRLDRTNKKHSEKSKEKMRLHKGKQKGKKNSQFGTIWIHKPGTYEVKKIKKYEILPDGFIKGRIIKNNGQA